jgi:hypothetical protein
LVDLKRIETVSVNEFIAADDIRKVVRPEVGDSTVRIVQSVVDDAFHADFLLAEEIDDLEELLRELLGTVKGRSAHEIALERIKDITDPKEREALRGLSREQPPFFSGEELDAIVLLVMQARDNFLQRPEVERNAIIAAWKSEGNVIKPPRPPSLDI